MDNLCRCCHSGYGFKSLNAMYTHEGVEFTYSSLLQKTLNIVVNPIFEEPDQFCYAICDTCIEQLHNAIVFKHQVVTCEQILFTQYNSQGFKGILSLNKTLKEDIILRNGLKEDTSQGNDGKEGAQYDNTGSVEPYNSSAEDNIEDLPLTIVESKDEKLDQEPEPDPESDVTGPDISEDEILKPDKQERTKKYACSVCSKQFTYYGSLEVHLLTHNGQNNFQCFICSEKFAKDKELTKHITLNHSENGTFPCNMCPKTFKIARLLKNHLESHFDKKKYKCSYCEKKFQRRRGLKDHMIRHTKEKKYTCDVCHKSFGHNQTLKSHILTHTGEKPFVCDVCGRRFAQRTHLKRHIILVHTEPLRAHKQV
ncbi:myoneurin-like isoform X3 [Battus philenor]|uniref:myoneurin-like isoform X3 n=1 Tax=Battus philenor TaxID=42288 RepID=UPI0035D02CD5